ncbi:MAG TPA: hypothetical protein VK097_00595 [Lentibacillus sp.]|nr:hypothetical protein [Lentibacillus sp.]
MKNVTAASAVSDTSIVREFFADNVVWNIVGDKPAIVIVNLWQFICTAIPIIYPTWMGAYNGMPSDGHRII